MAQLLCSYKLFATTQKCILLSIQSSLFLTLATRHTVQAEVGEKEGDSSKYVQEDQVTLPHGYFHFKSHMEYYCTI